MVDMRQSTCTFLASSTVAKVSIVRTFENVTIAAFDALAAVAESGKGAAN